MILKEVWKKILTKLSLRLKIIYFCILMFSTFIVLISFFTVNLLDKTILSSEIKYSLRNNLLIKNNYEGLISNTENLLKVLSTEPNLQETMLEINNYENLNSVFKLQKSYSLGKSVSNVIFPNTPIVGACIWDDEIFYSGYCLDEVSVKSAIPQDELKNSNNNQIIKWSSLEKLNFTNGKTDFVFPVSKPIIHKEFGYVLGYVSLFLSEKTVSKVFDISDLEDGSYDFYIISLESNQIISSTDKSLLFKNINSVLNLDKKKNDILFKKGNLLEKNKLYSILENRDRGYLILSKSDLSPFFYTRKIQFLIIGFIVFIAVIIVAFGSYWLSFTITKPIYSIMNVMRKIQNGNLSCRIEEEILDSELKLFAKAFNELMDRLESLIADIYQKQKDLRKSELLLIQSQINPHFLYNSLETVSSFVELNLYEKALEALQSISLFYRNILSNGRSIIKVKEEIEIISNYLEIQKLRYEEYLSFSIEVDEDIYEYEIPKLLLQPLVENSIYHGIKQLDKKGEIIICGYLKNNHICFEVYDTGIGIKKERLEILRKNLELNSRNEDDFFGLLSVKRRLNIYFNGRASLKIESKENEYTQIYITLPILERKKNYESCDN